MNRTLGYEGQQVVDRTAPGRLGLTLHDLMIRAAEAVVRECQTPGEAGLPVTVVVAGPGNNGGDAYAAARILHTSGAEVRIVEGLPDAPRSPLAALERDRAEAAGVRFAAALSDGPEAGLVVDGMFGAGFRAHRPIPETALNLIRSVNALADRGCRVISVDVPSGVEADTGRTGAVAVRADVTVSFVRGKTGLYLYPGRLHAGRIVVDRLGIEDTLVEDILTGMPPSPVLLEAGTLAAFRPERPADGHKGVFGRVLVAGGSAGMTGAAMLAAGAALRNGAGMVYALVSPEARAGIGAR
ncbi:MAG: NAD(P)H-hydrate epimerase, partial [Clostridia bacterium]|nr:NAD(P)H-hydrate epimerase [Clostridia bacterium]